MAVILEIFLAGISVGPLYLLAVLPVVRWWGWGWGLAATGLAALLLVGVVVEPRLSLAVADPHDYIRIGFTVAGMALVVLVTTRHQRGRDVIP